MAFPSIDFNDIRIIVCVQGYGLDYQYIVREIGFWFNGNSGSIPFNCKINRNHLDIPNQRIITYCEEKINGIRLKKSIDSGLALSETRAVLRTLYHLNENSKAKFIGVIPEDNITGLLYKAGLGSYVKDLNQLSIFKNSEGIPSNSIIKSEIENKSGEYKICKLHDFNLIDNSLPFCAKIKAEYLANYCLNTAFNLQKNNLENLYESKIVI